MTLRNQVSLIGSPTQIDLEVEGFPPALIHLEVYVWFTPCSISVLVIVRHSKIVETGKVWIILHEPLENSEFSMVADKWDHIW